MYKFFLGGGEVVDPLLLIFVLKRKTKKSVTSQDKSPLKIVIPFKTKLKNEGSIPPQLPIVS